jgi:GNAT superfamily N-acetyltransferase
MPNLRTIHEEDLASCVAFLAERERRCISLMSNFIQDGAPALPAGRKIRALVRFSDTPTSPVDGIILVLANGILLHCIRESVELGRYSPVIARFLSRIPVRCVIGDRDHSLFLESFLPGKPTREVDYQLMVYEPDGQPPEPPAGIEFVRCTVEDTEQLLPLQENYEKEEVAPPGDPVDQEAVRISLRTNLAKQHIFMALADRRVVAKAGTNALGLAWVQLGGVYTEPDWRGRGIAASLVRHIANHEREDGKNIALFVKLTNEPARRAYNRSGFKPDTFFRISYW